MCKNAMTQNLLFVKKIARDRNLFHHLVRPLVSTVFHRVRFSLRKAVSIVFEMRTTAKNFSTKQIAKQLKLKIIKQKKTFSKEKV